MRSFPSLSELIFINLMLGLCAHADECPPGFVKNENSCYWFSRIKGTFPEASATCRYLHSDLAAITSKQENSFIGEQIAKHAKSGEYYYIGGSDLRHEGTWTWQNPTQKFVYTKWGPREPNNIQRKNIGEHCLAVSLTNNVLYWTDVKCSLKVFFVCESGIPALVSKRPEHLLINKKGSLLIMFK